MGLTIEKSADRLVARSDTVSWPAGLTLLGFLVVWNAVASQDLPRAWAGRSWALAARPLAGIAVATVALGSFALFALGHQRLTLSPDGLENAWVVIRPIRRRFIPLADIASIDVLTEESGESHSTYLRTHTRSRQVDWTLFVGTDDPDELRNVLRRRLRTLKA